MQAQVKNLDARDLILPNGHPRVAFRGVYAKVPNKMVNGKPCMKQTDGARYLYYGGSDLWLFTSSDSAPKDGESAGFLHTVERNLASPVAAESWTVFVDGKWTVDDAVRVT